MKQLTTLFLSFFYIGFISGIAGTLASIASIPLTLQLFPILPFEAPDRPIAYIGIITLLVLFGVVAITYCDRIPKDKIDQPFIVLDEIVGMMIALFPVVMSTEFLWYSPLIALGLFRFFDISKPLGIGKIDKMNTPLSVMMDDVVAGGYSAIILGFYLMV